jgi:cytochrome c oxidase subunit 2
VSRGQGAEFCGDQHAKMALFVVAEPPAAYSSWAQASQAQATPPSDPQTIHGQQVFMKSSCALCHNIEGTLAASHAGPDLTHLASRRTIAAGTIRNTRGNLAGWIVDPQRIKPGVHMPPNQLTPQDLEALLTYLQSLR